eukprot:gene22716-28871_t
MEAELFAEYAIEAQIIDWPNDESTCAAVSTQNNELREAVDFSGVLEDLGAEFVTQSDSSSLCGLRQVDELLADTDFFDGMDDLAAEFVTQSDSSSLCGGPRQQMDEFLADMAFFDDGMDTAFFDDGMDDLDRDCVSVRLIANAETLVRHAHVPILADIEAGQGAEVVNAHVPILADIEAGQGAEMVNAHVPILADIEAGQGAFNNTSFYKRCCLSSPIACQKISLAPPESITDKSITAIASHKLPLQVIHFQQSLVQVPGPELWKAFVKLFRWCQPKDPNFVGVSDILTADIAAREFSTQANKVTTQQWRDQCMCYFRDERHSVLTKAGSERQDELKRQRTLCALPQTTDDAVSAHILRDAFALLVSVARKQREALDRVEAARAVLLQRRGLCAWRAVRDRRVQARGQAATTVTSITVPRSSSDAQTREEQKRSDERDLKLFNSRCHCKIQVEPSNSSQWTCELIKRQFEDSIAKRLLVNTGDMSGRLPSCLNMPVNERSALKNLGILLIGRHHAHDNKTDIMQRHMFTTYALPLVFGLRDNQPPNSIYLGSVNISTGADDYCCGLGLEIHLDAVIREGFEPCLNIVHLLDDDSTWVYQSACSIVANEILAVCWSGDENPYIVDPRNGLRLENKCKFWLIKQCTGRQKRPEVFTFLSDINAPRPEEVRVYQVKVGRQRSAKLIKPTAVVPVPFIDTLKLQQTPNSDINLGMNKFNAYAFDFGKEKFLHQRNGVVVKLQYRIVSPHTARSPSEFKNSGNWNCCSGRKTTLGIEAISKCHPDERWGVCEPPGCGSCLPHSGAAYMLVMKVIDAEKCPMDSSKTQLEFFREQALGDVAADRTELPDISGRNPPAQGNYESVSEFQEAVESYDKQWKEAREIVRAKYIAQVAENRIPGSYNTTIQLVGMALLTKKMVEVYTYAGDRFVQMERYVPDNNDGSVIPLLYDKESEHYMVGIPLQSLATFTTPKHKLKNAMTHDYDGRLRATELTIQNLGVGSIDREHAMPKGGRQGRLSVEDFDVYGYSRARFASSQGK